MNVLITGALGFSARHLAARLRTQPGVCIAGTDLAPHNGGNGRFDSYTPLDLTNQSALNDLVRQTKPDRIFHLAGAFRGPASALYQINLWSSVCLLEAVKAHAPNAAVLLIGTAAEYGNWPASEMPLSEDHPCRPATAYGLSKFAMTQAAQYLARAEGIKVVVARPFNLLGAGMPASLAAGAVVQRALSAVANGEAVIQMGNCRPRRDFVAIEDAVEAYVRLLEAGPWGEVVNVCSGEAHSIEEIVRCLLALSPRPLDVLEDPALLRPNDPMLVVGDTQKLRNLCGFTPQSRIEDSLRAAWQAAAGPVPPAAQASFRT